MTLARPRDLGARCEREPGTAVWSHELLLGGASMGRMTDFVDAEAPVFVRCLDLMRPLELELRIGEGAEALENGRRFEAHGARAALLVTQPRGTPVFMKYPSPVPFHHQVVVSGRASMQRVPGSSAWRIACEPGASKISIAGGRAYPECIETAEAALSTPEADLLSRTRGWWRRFSARRHEVTTAIPSDVPRRGDLLQAIDDVAVLIKAQQGVEGGILAGLSYHWAAFRDQFGAMRCLLALGHAEEAAAVLRCYGDVFTRRGVLHNGQDIGLDGFFHVHENDEVEITGYLLVQAFDYLRATGDDGLLRGLFPLLEWAFEAQCRNLVRHMLPFNGDETYIAGGMLPRGAINDGSAESTMLFVTGGSRFLEWTEQQGLWPVERIARGRRAVEETRAHYRENFWREGSILTNNPERMSVAEMPRFRHGVCESGGFLAECAGLRCQGGAHRMGREDRGWTLPVPVLLRARGHAPAGRPCSTWRPSASCPCTWGPTSSPARTSRRRRAGSSSATNVSAGSPRPPKGPARSVTISACSCTR